MHKQSEVGLEVYLAMKLHLKQPFIIGAENSREIEFFTLINSVKDAITVQADRQAFYEHFSCHIRHIQNILHKQLAVRKNTFTSWQLIVI